jgi:iron complex transport system ATP-binding protein
MDEPVGHLDPKHADRIMQLGRSLADQGLAVVMVLHELNLAAAWADDAWLLHQGRLAAAGPWPDVIHPDTLSPVYDVPLHTVAHHPTGRPILTTRPAHCPV